MYTVILLWFQMECLAQLRHPGIVNLVAVCLHDSAQGPAYALLTEFIEGQSLHVVLHGSQFAGSLSVSDDDDLVPRSSLAQLEVASSVCDALAFLHSADIVHGDLTSEHVLVTSNRRIKLTGFAGTNPRLSNWSSPFTVQSK
jgi:serine/threonine protein kinase